MIDFENMAFLKLRPVTDTRLTGQVTPLLCPGERIVQQYQGIRDGIVFTDHATRMLEPNENPPKNKRRVTAHVKKSKAAE